MSRLSKLLSPSWVANRLWTTVQNLLGWKKILFYVRNPTPGEFTGTLVEIVRAPSDVPYSAETMKSRIRSGHKLYALVENGAAVCYGWLSPSSKIEIDELKRVLKSSRRIRWIWDCVTPEEHRGKGYYTKMLKGFQAKFPRQNVLGIYVNSRNEASKRGIESSGFQPWLNITSSYVGTKLKSPDPKTKDQISLKKTA